MSLPYESAHSELHFINRSGWLRAAVLGANDGIVSVSSLIVGVAAADSTPSTILIAGTAGLAAGAMSMAAGEYVSVSSQSDIERADIAREKKALIDTPKAEERELVSIFESRGLSTSTAALVARELTEKDALSAHVREELGLSDVHSARPLQGLGFWIDLLNGGGTSIGCRGVRACRSDNPGCCGSNFSCLGCPWRDWCRGGRGSKDTSDAARSFLGGCCNGHHSRRRTPLWGERLKPGP
jgi:VIT1/CCC1 family predicted Fe2+/Mn2+ transporter